MTNLVIEVKVDDMFKLGNLDRTALRNRLFSGAGEIVTGIDGEYR